MNSFILISKNEEKRNAYQASFLQQHNISPFDHTVVTTDTPSIGIEVIRDLQRSIYFKPLKGEKRLITIENAQTLTHEAQNALLKILEEPPLHTYFSLSATSGNAFLPTILSRCNVIFLEEEKTVLTQEQEGELFADFEQITGDSISPKLSLAEKLSSDKEKAKEWLENMIRLLHDKMLTEENNQRDYALVLSELQSAYTTIQTTNVNLRLLLEHTFLSLT